MGCSTCGSYTPPKKETAFDRAVRMAQTEATIDMQVYVIVQYENIFYHECLKCRLQNGNTEGTIILYVR